jgi:deoxyribonuclease (pyrimidine dimer)
MDQHLFAEFRELKMIPKSLQRSLQAAARYTSHPQEYVLRKVPSEYVLGKGHVSFFYDKGKYLQKRYAQVCSELKARGIGYNPDRLLDPDGVLENPVFCNDYIPTDNALALVRQRIAERVAMKPNWYRKTHGA